MNDLSVSGHILCPYSQKIPEITISVTNFTIFPLFLGTFPWCCHDFSQHGKLVYPDVEIRTGSHWSIWIPTSCYFTFWHRVIRWHFCIWKLLWWKTIQKLHFVLSLRFSVRFFLCGKYSYVQRKRHPRFTLLIFLLFSPTFWKMIHHWKAKV